MTQQPLVSVIIPVYNNESYIEMCLSSLVRQSYHNLQIIVINDGSSDASGEIISRMAAEDKRICYISQNNKGVSRARNAGIAKAEGEYLTFVDGDDYVGKDYIMEYVACAVEHQADMVLGGLSFVDEDGQLISSLSPREYIRYEREEWLFRIGTVAVHFYKRAMWETYHVRFFEDERGEDMPISLFFAAICERIAILPTAQYYYVQHRDSAMHTLKGTKQFPLPYRSLEKTIQKIHDIGIKNGRDFHELYVLRIMVTMVQLAKGKNKEEVQYLGVYIKTILNQYYPVYYKNKLTHIFSGLDIPFVQRVAVKLLVMVARYNMLPVALKIIC